MSTVSISNQQAILADLVESLPLDVEINVAKALLTLRFSTAQRERMRELLDKNNCGTITPAEHAEMEDYRSVGGFVDLLQAKARLTLKQASEPTA